MEKLGMLFAVLLTSIGFFAIYDNPVYTAAGEFCQMIWTKIYNLCGGDPFVLNFHGLYLVGSLAYWGTGMLFLCLDVIGKPKALMKYKIQQDKNNPLKPKDLASAIFVGLFNFYIVGVPLQLAFMAACKWRGIDNGPLLPSFPTALGHLLVCVAVAEILFYYNHRLFHHPLLYKRFHKMHHEWTAPIGITAVYGHPVEHIMVNMVPLTGGPIVCGCHISVIWFWFCLGASLPVINHCGYHLPFFPSGEHHDYHHAKFVDNFGPTGILDWLHGTDGSFRKSKCFQRHRVICELTPANVLYPEKETRGCKTE